MNTKGDLINAAYSRGRISGLTAIPSPEDITLALRRLENMAEEFEGRNVSVGYFFEDDPDVNTLHNIPKKYWDAFETNLAVRLLGDFGKEPIPMLTAFQQSGYAFLSSSTAVVPQTSYPSRQPIGSGNSRYIRQRFYSPTVEAPVSAETIKMIVGDINDFVEHFDSYLRDGETIASHTIVADVGLTLVSDSLATPDIDYRIQADEESQNGILQVTIVATTDLGRIETRVIDFELTTL